MRQKLDNPGQKVPYSVLVAALETQTPEAVAAAHGVSVATVNLASRRAWSLARQDAIRAERAAAAAKAVASKPRQKPAQRSRITAEVKAEIKKAQMRNYKLSDETKATWGVRKGLDLTRGLPLGFAVEWKQNRFHYYMWYNTDEYRLHLDFSDKTTKYRFKGYNLTIEHRKPRPRIEYRVASPDPFALPSLLLARIPEGDKLHGILAALIKTDAEVRTPQSTPERIALRIQ